jgi:hypothetical protein
MLVNKDLKRKVPGPLGIFIVAILKVLLLASKMQISGRASVTVICPETAVYR